MQDRALASERKSCRKLTMGKSLSISDPLLLNSLFLQQALREYLFIFCSHFTWLRDRFENAGWIITFWFLSLKVNISQRKQMFLNIESTVSLSKRNLWDSLKENKGEQMLGSVFNQRTSCGVVTGEQVTSTQPPTCTTANQLMRLQKLQKHRRLTAGNEVEILESSEDTQPLVEAQHFSDRKFLT